MLTLSCCQQWMLTVSCCLPVANERSPWMHKRIACYKANSELCYDDRRACLRRIWATFLYIHLQVRPQVYWVTNVNVFKVIVNEFKLDFNKNNLTCKILEDWAGGGEFLSPAVIGREVSRLPRQHIDKHTPTQDKLSNTSYIIDILSIFTPKGFLDTTGKLWSDVPQIQTIIDRCYYGYSELQQVCTF